LKFFDKSTFESEYYFFATALDPRYKLWIFEKHTDLFGEGWVKDCRKALVDTLSREYDDGDITITGVTIPSKRASGVEDDWEREMKAMLLDDDITGITANEEFATYLAEARNRMDPLDWWKINAGRFPRLAKMARDYLAIPGM
jgi:hypothetical protein